MSIIIRCPCCVSERVISYNNPEPHVFCMRCLYRGKNIIPSRKYYKRLTGCSDSLDNDLKKKTEERMHFLRRFLRDGMRILEFGCAEGALGEAVKCNYKVIYHGIEPSRDAHIARTKLDRVLTSIWEIRPNRRFDLILAFHVFEHIRGLAHVVSRMYRLLNDNGIVAVETPNYFGNIQLPWDFNSEHINFFSAPSISSLLEKRGFATLEIRTGYYQSAIYNDSMRIVVRKTKSHKEKRRDLIARFKRLLGGRFVVFGAGGDFETLVRPYVKASSISAIVDSSKRKIGKKMLGKTIETPEAIANYPNENVLIATYRYQKEILEILKRNGISKFRIITLEYILNNL